MLKFTSAGGTAVRIEWGDRSVVIFPEKMEKANATVTLLAHPEEVPTDGAVSWPGEYDYSGISIRGIGHNDGAQVSFTLEMDGVRIGAISSPLQEWNDHDMELLGDLAVLILPADDLKLAQKLLDEVDPRVLIPVEGKGGKNMGELLKIAGAQGKGKEKEYKLKGLPAEGREVVVLG